MYLLFVGMLSGIVIEKMRFDRHRADILRRFDDALRNVQAYRMALEKDATAR
jgi:hypothetical protein